MGFNFWLQDAHVRIFPFGNKSKPDSLVLDVARGERIAFQTAAEYMNQGDDAEVVTVEAEVCTAPFPVRIRRVGFVPVPHFNTGVPDDEKDCIGHIPGYVPDPLFDENKAKVAAGETCAFWFTADIPESCPAGKYEVEIRLVVEDKKITGTLSATFIVHEVVIKKRENFPVVQWFYNDSILDWHGLKPFEEEFWQRVKPYMLNLVLHGQDTIYAPIFTPPLDGVKRPTQLLGVKCEGEGRYSFDGSDVKRYVDLAKECGIENFEWTHLFTQWGARNALRIYEGQGVDEKLLWEPETEAASETYRTFLARFLPEFKSFLDNEKLLEFSFFHVSDEPHGEEGRANYLVARTILRELAPWMKTMDALSEIEYGREGITDMPIPSIRVTKQFHDEGIPSFTYFCCNPRRRYLNRLVDTPLAKMRMLGWLCRKFEVRGFLHWGYNYWQQRGKRELVDPFTELSAGDWPEWAYGDCFLVYPGPDGPIDSIRWEIFSESLQDLALLQTLDIHPSDPILSEFEDFNKFPKSLDWLRRTRRDLLLRGRARQAGQ